MWGWPLWGAGRGLTQGGSMPHVEALYVCFIGGSVTARQMQTKLNKTFSMKAV